MCNSSRLEQEAKMLARAMMYNWKRSASSTHGTPQAEMFERMPSFGDYVCRGLDASNNPVASGNPAYASQDSDCSLSGDGNSQPKAGALADAGEESYSETQPEEFEVATDILFKIAHVFEDAESQVPRESQARLLKSLVVQEIDELPSYSEFKKAMLEAVKPFVGNLVKSIAIVMRLTTAVLSGMSDMAVGTTLSPQVQAQLSKYTQDLIVDIASTAGMTSDDSIVQRVRSQGEAELRKGVESEL